MKGFCGTVAILWILFSSTLVQASSPGEAIIAANVDCKSLGPDVRATTRYLWMGMVPLADREDLIRGLAFWTNSLSRSPEIVTPRVVGTDLIRLNLIDYDWKTDVWEKLADVDPYFHIQQETEQIERWGVPDGKGGWKNVEERKTGKKTIQSSHITFPNNGATEELIQQTQSKAPIVRADWWMVQTLRQLSLSNKQTGVGYYDWIGVKNRKDFEKLLRLNVKDSIDIGKEMRAAVEQSGVATQNRQVVRLQSLTGGSWATLDTDDGTKEGNAIRNLKRGSFKHKAEEHYGTLPNGLFAFLLCDADGELQPSAPDFIGPDDSVHRRGRDGRIHVGISCIRCHVEGLRPIDDWVRRQPKIITSPDYAELVQLRRQYFSNLQRQLGRDRLVYQESLMETNGLTPLENSKVVANIWNRYVEEPVGLQQAAAEIGVPQEVLKRKITGNGDALLVGLIATPPVTITRLHWEESFSMVMQLVYGGKP